jgi:hypothetical protein
VNTEADTIAAALSAGGPIEVLGDDAAADALRAALDALPLGAGAVPPHTVVELTGTVAGAAHALERVAGLGTVVLAGPLAEDAGPLDLYTHLHVRGLTLVGVPPASEHDGDR